MQHDSNSPNAADCLISSCPACLGESIARSKEAELDLLPALALLIQADVLGLPTLQLGEIELATGRRIELDAIAKVIGQRACRAAADGALERGLYYIVRELRHAYPNNAELKELHSVLVRRAP